MNPRNSLQIVGFQPQHADELVPMWRASFEAGVGIVDPYPLEEQRIYLFDELVPNNEIRVAFENEQIVGFVAASKESISQLYVRIGSQRRGIGSRLLDWAKDQSGGSLWLYTFESNVVAQTFYESRGFEIVDRGFEQQWQLNDIKYRWVKDDDPTVAN